MNDLPNRNDLEMRIQRIEELIGLGGRNEAASFSLHPAWPLLLGLVAVALGYLGLGYPQHYYQFLFSLLLVLLFYHRGFLRTARGNWKWPQIAINFLILCLLFKLLIGGGVSHPFDWFKLPAIAKVPPPPSGDQSWYARALPDYAVQWQAIPTLAAWSIDITKIQTFLLIAILAGALFRFEPFTSIAALVLLIVSITTYLHYDWNWVILFLIAGSVSLYLQARIKMPPRYP
jgi:hypothetical protein